MKLSEYSKNNDVELTEEQVSKLNKVLGTKESKVWKPKENEKYYYIDCDGSIEDDYWYECESNEEIYSMANIFKTEEQAEFELEKRKIIAELKHFTDENNDEIDWKNENEKWYIYYDISRGTLDSNCCWQARDLFNIYFTSKELVEEAIEKFGDRIKKYLLEVEE